MKTSLQELGAKLVEESRLNEEFSFQRGLINKLFPFIYEASKRMSCRGISRWLEANGTKLSAATIAKALRNPQSYWQEIYEDIQPAALIFARAHEADPDDILENFDLFFCLKDRPPVIEGKTPDVLNDLLNEYHAACGKIQQDWFSIPAIAREICLSNVSDEDKAPAESEQKSKDAAV